tara:strand:- start:617 stop:1627 length:1011 start_codon:yes stop_codon:yes gene_type:complete
MINIGVIGLGYWGPNLLRNFLNNKNCHVSAICDTNKPLLNKYKNKYPKINCYTDYKKLINDKQIDACVIATPVMSHYEIASFALSKYKHVFVEKPLADTSNKCKKLISSAKQHNLVLFVDHTFLYTDSVRTLKKYSQKNYFGEKMYYDSTRINLGLIQNDINVLWDLAVHDLSILNFLYKDKPISVSAVGHKHFPSKPITSAFMTLKYKSNFVAHINVSWLSPVKIRQTILAGSKKMILYNDLERKNKIIIHNKGVNVIKNENSSKNLVKYKIGGTHTPILKNREALSFAVDDFTSSINRSKQPISNGNIALSIVKILESADRSMKYNGKSINIKL